LLHLMSLLFTIGTTQIGMESLPESQRGVCEIELGGIVCIES
jgi:hypothetical protein